MNVNANVSPAIYVLTNGIDGFHDATNGPSLINKYADVAGRLNATALGCEYAYVGVSVAATLYNGISVVLYVHNVPLDEIARAKS